MSTLCGSCAVPTHPCVRRMELLRRASADDAEAGRLNCIGCICGIIYRDSPAAHLDNDGHSAASCRLTAMCRHSEKPLAGDILNCGAERYIIRAVLSDAGTLQAVVEKEDT